MAFLCWDGWANLGHLKAEHILPGTTNQSPHTTLSSNSMPRQRHYEGEPGEAPQWQKLLEIFLTPGEELSARLGDPGATSRQFVLPPRGCQQQSCSLLPQRGGMQQPKPVFSSAAAPVAGWSLGACAQCTLAQ